MESNEFEDIYDESTAALIDSAGRAARQQQDQYRAGARVVVADITPAPEASEESLLTGDELEILWACEDKIAHGLKAFLEVAEALHTIRTQRLYREDYPNFTTYCREKWNLTDRHARNLANAWDVLVTIDPDPIGNAELLPQNERQARELKQVPHDRRTEVWETAVAAAGGVEHVCAHDVKTAREAVMGTESEQVYWGASADLNGIGTSGMVFEREAEAEPQRERDVVVISNDPRNHAERIINKHGATYATELATEIANIIAEKRIRPDDL